MSNLAIPVGERIREAMSRLNWTEDRLLEKAGLTGKLNVSEIEKGIREPSVHELSLLADALRVDFYDLLYGPLRKRPPVKWRAMPEEEPEFWAEDFLRNCERYHFLERLEGQCPEDKLCELRSSSPVTNKRCAQRLAKTVSEPLRLGRRPACALRDVLEADYGVKIWHGTHGSGASTYGDFGPAVLLNAEHAPWRRTFSLAHELFHLLTWSNDGAPISSPEWPKRTENLADEFAANLLLPRDELIPAFERLVHNNTILYLHLVNLAREFGVSTEALMIRLRNLQRLTSEDVETTLGDERFKELDRQSMPEKWTSSPPPFPKRFVELGFAAYKKGNLSRGRLSEFLSTDRGDLNQVLSQYGLDEDQDCAGELTAH